MMPFLGTTRRVQRDDARAPRNAATGILAGAAPRSIGPENAPGAVLFVHGFGGCGNNFHNLPDRVAAAGWRVRVMLLPGHGRSPLDFEATRADTLVQAVVQETQALRKAHETVVVLGHSMGGALATIAAGQAPPDALILGAPYFGITHHWFYLAPPERWIKTLSPFIHWVHADPSRQPVKRREISREIISYTWHSSRAGLTAMGIAARAAAPETLQAIMCPVLLLHSVQDAVASPDAARCVFNKIPSTWRRAVWLENSDHVIFWDHDREKVAGEMLAFLERIERYKEQSAAAAAPAAAIRPITAGETRPIRHAVLRQGKPFAATVWTGDEDENTVHFGAFDGNTLTGVASVYAAAPPGESGAGYFQLRGMAVLPEWRGKRLGAALTRACVAHAHGKSAQCLWCNARAHARGFYEHMGFQVSGGMFEIESIGPHFQMRHALNSSGCTDAGEQGDTDLPPALSD